MTTKIPWVKNPDNKTSGIAWNPITGCLNCTTDGKCGGQFPCWAYKVANGRLKSRYLVNSNLPCHNEPNHELHHSNPFYPRFWDDKCYKLVPQVGEHRKAKGVFVCDMSDLFGIGIPPDWTSDVLDVIRRRFVFAWHEKQEQWRFYLLTKQPQNAIKFNPFPSNCWVGLSITQCLDRIGYMADIQATLKFISFEPLLYYDVDTITASELLRVNGIHWAIIGSQTKPTIHPPKEQVINLIDACDKIKIPVFVKEPLASYYNIHRQEMPTTID